MDEKDIDIALDIIQLKIVNFIKNNKSKNKKEVISQLRYLLEEKEKIYDLDKKVIDKVYNQYLKELKEEGINE